MTGSARDLPFGATLVAPDRTRFRLWAPACQAVAVEIDGGASVAMRRSADGWFEAEARCGAGTRYRYRLDDGLAVPDPASRAQADDVHDPSLVVDPRAYRWRHPDWRGRKWQESVLYELHVGALGGFAGVQAAFISRATRPASSVTTSPRPGDRPSISVAPKSAASSPRTRSTG